MAKPAGLGSAELIEVGKATVAPAMPMVLVSPWVAGVHEEKSRVRVAYGRMKACAWAVTNTAAKIVKTEPFMQCTCARLRPKYKDGSVRGMSLARPSLVRQIIQPGDTQC